MQEGTKEKIKLTTRQILLYLVDGVVNLADIFDGRRRHRKTWNEYYYWREIDKDKFSHDLYRLRRQKFIKTYIQEKEKYIELDKKGKEKIKEYLVGEIKITKPKSWDKKWRIVIFDIPESKKTARDALASMLKRLGFIRLQKSVFVYPFECYQEINQIKIIYRLEKYVQYIVADRVETEIDLLKVFYDRQILDEKIIKNFTIKKSLTKN